MRPAAKIYDLEPIAEVGEGTATAGVSSSSPPAVAKDPGLYHARGMASAAPVFAKGLHVNTHA